MVALARDGTDTQKEEAAGAIFNLAAAAENKAAIREAGGLAPLIDLARQGTEGQKEEAAGALWSLTLDPDNQVALYDMIYR